MIVNDTIRLLRECDSGVKMGISSINDVIEKIDSNEFKQKLNDCKSEHQQLQSDIDNLLNVYHDNGKKPNPIAKSMSWMKTNIMLG